MAAAAPRLTQRLLCAGRRGFAKSAAQQRKLLQQVQREQQQQQRQKEQQQQAAEWQRQPEARDGAGSTEASSADWTFSSVGAGSMSLDASPEVRNNYRRRWLQLIDLEWATEQARTREMNSTPVL